MPWDRHGMGWRGAWAHGRLARWLWWHAVPRGMQSSVHKCTSLHTLLVPQLSAPQLHPSQFDPAVLEHLPGPGWVPEAKRVTPAMFLRKLAGKKLSLPPAEVTTEQLLEADTLANRLRYILTETMGADGELERRAAELEHITQGGGSIANLVRAPARSQSLRAGSGVWEEEQRIIDAVDSFRASVEPGGFMSEFVSCGVLGVVVGEVRARDCKGPASLT